MNDPAVILEPETGPQLEDADRKSIHLGMLGRTPPFTKRQRRVFWIASTAGFFDQYDRALLSLALKQIQAGLKIAESQLGAMLSIVRLGYLLSLLMTPFADVFGRRRLLLYTVFGYTIFTGLIAIAPDERAFVAFEIIARAFAGAEAAIAMVIVAEEVDAAYRGWAIGLLGASLEHWLRPGRDRVRVHQRDSLRMARAVRDCAAAAGADHSASSLAAGKRALRERETRRTAASENLGAGRSAVQRIPATAHHDAVDRIPGLDGRQRGRLSVSEVSAGDASLVAGQRLVAWSCLVERSE